MIKRTESAGDPGKRRFTVVAYATEGTPYEAEAQVLKLSLESHKIPYEISYVKNLGSWQKNTQYKSTVVMEMLSKYRSISPIVYIDVDAIVVSYPSVFDTCKADIAAVHFAGGNELLSGTVFFNNTVRCMEVVQMWQKLNKRHPEILPDGRDAWDQRTLAMAIASVKCTFEELPQGYTWITELTQKKYKDLRPVILHTRGAKRYKNQINGVPGYAS